MYEFIRTENGMTTTRVSGADGLAEVNNAMMGPGRRKVRSMSSSDTHHNIEYKDGRLVKLVRVLVETPAADSNDPAEWHGTASHFNHLHRFTVDNRARCNRRIQANKRPPVGGQGEWDVFKSTKAEILASEHADLYIFCPRCEAVPAG
ncbi:hypothetical protein OH723_24150 [Streptomyces albidoflavus]|uniref:hypothetical protein n=1 Tax=Streptomyces albidoflavus TaxID=1886 RepID=UPI0038665588|nr:hypothetical protein OH723_24150 [Streptomyces albidoflavus]